jgi:glycosyltransferase involved in cell wall biosynthesis
MLKAKNMMPKVSIIIPVYNGSNYLAEAIDSAVAQTYANIEVVVVNDGSNDDGATESIVLSYGDKIRYFSKSNGGVASALNLGIEKMTGEYFSWLSHDDVYHPNKIQTQIDYLIKYNKDEDVILFSDWDIIDSNSNIIDHVVSDHQLLEAKPFYSLLRSRIHGCTLLIPRRLFFKIDKFDENLRTTQDYDLWFKMLLKGVKFVHIPKALIKSRHHTEQDTHKNPQANMEADKLWSKFALEIPSKQMVELEGSIEKFYSELSRFLFDTPYKYAANFVRGLELISVLKAIQNQRPIKLIFSHMSGGGTESVLQEHLLDKNLVILIRKIGGSYGNNVEIVSNNNIVNSYTFTQLSGLFNALSLLDIAEVHINHLIDLINETNKLIQLKNNELQMVYSSTSWKLTKPLRVVGHFIRQFMRF